MAAKKTMACVLMVISVGLPSSAVSAGTAATARATTTERSAPTPDRLSGGVADVLVRISGGAVCSGTPITGTPFVVTAAHCVLDRDGNVGSRTVIRDGVEYDAAAVLVDVRYHDTPVAALDAAVLVLDRPIPGSSATLGTALPATGRVTLAGFQPLDSDGTLLRGTNPHNLPLPKAARGQAGGVVEIETAPAGCQLDIASVETTPAWVDVPCGLIPGASGGGLFATRGDSFELVGIVSWVSADITHNGVAPIDSLRELLEHQADYLHIAGQESEPATTMHISRS
jgi:hypothetical protein